MNQEKRKLSVVILTIEASAINAEILSMKTENDERLSKDESIAFPAEKITEKADELRDIAETLRLLYKGM